MARLCSELQRLVRLEAPPPPQVSPELELEARIIADGSDLVASLGMPDDISLFNCPECGGPLAGQRDRPLRYRCTVGHSFSVSSLHEGMRRQIESSLWVAIRLLQQRATLGRTRSEKEREKGRAFGARSYLGRAEEDASHAEVLRQFLMQMNGEDRSTAPEDPSLEAQPTGTGPK